jgi:hypothetical protein
MRVTFTELDSLLLKNCCLIPSNLLKYLNTNLQMVTVRGNRAARIYRNILCILGLSYSRVLSTFRYRTHNGLRVACSSNMLHLRRDGPHTVHANYMMDLTYISAKISLRWGLVHLFSYRKLTIQYKARVDLLV